MSQEHPDFYAALLRQSGQSVAVLGTAVQPPIFFGRANALLKACLEAPDASSLASAIETLLKTGVGFERALSREDGSALTIRGRPVGRRAVLYFREEHSAVRAQPLTAADAGLLETLPQAIALFDAERRLNNFNSAYAAFWGLDSAWLTSHPPLGEILNRLREQDRLPQQRDFAAWKARQHNPLSPGIPSAEDIWHLPDGKAVRVQAYAWRDSGFLLLFEDVSAQLGLETSLNLLTQVQQATLDTLDEAIGIFGTDGRLVLYNAHFAALWRLSESDLAGQPHFGDIAALFAARAGQDGIWEAVAAGISSANPDDFNQPRTLRRADGRLLSLSMARLPNGATITTFTDLTDLERFEAADEALPNAGRTRA